LSLSLTEANYHSKEANRAFCSASQFKDFYGAAGLPGCEAKALAKITGEWTFCKGGDEEPSIAMMIGSYVDAHFSGTLPTFRAQTPELFKKDGSLKATFENAGEMIDVIEADPLFMKTLTGGKQFIGVAEFFGLPWKFKLDVYCPGKSITDLKTTKSITNLEWNLTHNKKISFIEAWGYDIQGGIYQKGIEVLTGDRLPFFISAISKEKHPDKEVFNLSQALLDNALFHVESMSERLMKVKAGEIPPKRCGVCAYCRKTKKLVAPVLFPAAVA